MKKRIKVVQEAIIKILSFFIMLCDGKVDKFSNNPHDRLYIGHMQLNDYFTIINYVLYPQKNYKKKDTKF